MFLYKAASIPGIYVPSLYDIEYNEDGTIQKMEPVVSNELYAELCKTDPGITAEDIFSGIPTTVVKQVESDLDHTYYPKHPLAPYIRAVQDRVVLEIQRGCIRGCRFCQAGMIYRPIRPRSLDYLKKLAIEMLDSTGYEEMTLSSLSSSDYEEL